eukprot:TRINITY_DN24172_c0_g1_i1.p2 TRINITY_DN24172_c0_g1~~TRINITY_DN24172_c0_g1_i1.p2  ORF type:complete len:278 (-),score=60.30 TRINITY_DN24172_c0_g1_i1:287-1120(-)
MSTVCTFQDDGYIGDAIGLLLILGVWASYIPQHIAIIRSRSSEGVSWLMIFLGNVSTCANTINVLVMQFDAVSCCPQLRLLDCLRSMLSICQIATGWINQFVLYVLVCVYYPVHKDSRAPVEQRRALLGFGLYALLVLLGLNLVAALLVWQRGPHDTVTINYAFAVGILSTVAVAVQWTPQIVTTFRAKAAGSLSIAMMLLQTPGSFLVVIFQAFFHHANVSTWLPFFVQGVEQCVVLVMCIVFEIRIRAKKRKQDQEINSMIEEKAPLIRKSFEDY